MSQQELRVMIRPDGLLLEWTDTTEHYPEAIATFSAGTRLDGIMPNLTPGCLFLSFSDPHLPLAPSLAFWRDLACQLCR